MVICNLCYVFRFNAKDQNSTRIYTSGPNHFQYINKDMQDGLASAAMYHQCSYLYFTLKLIKFSYVQLILSLKACETSFTRNIHQLIKHYTLCILEKVLILQHILQFRDFKI